MLATHSACQRRMECRLAEAAAGEGAAGASRPPTAGSHPAQWAAFCRLDADGSGALDRAELQGFVAGMAGDVAGELLAALDADGDGEGDFEGFCRKIGWSTKDSDVERKLRWFGASEFTYDTSAPRGHLPLTSALRGTTLLKKLLDHPAWDLEDGDTEFDGKKKK